MSGGVPKRIQISRTQRNTPSKAGNPVAKNAIILCNGARSRRAMCNYVMKRTNVFSHTSLPSDLLLINTVQPTAPFLDTVIVGYKNSSAEPIQSDDIDNVGTPAIMTPQNYDTYDSSLYEYVAGTCGTPGCNWASSSLDIDLSTMNGGDTYKFIIMMFDTWEDGGGQSNPPLYNTVSATGTNPIGALQINFGVAKKPTGNVLNVNPLTLQQSFVNVSLNYKFLVIDLTLSADKKSVTHTIIT